MKAHDPLRLVVASRNSGKLREIGDLLAIHGVSVVGIDNFPDVPEVVEDGNSFAENAAKKAREPALRLSEWVLGEDSGLEVDALGGAPGIFSARYSDPGATEESNNAKLMQELTAVPNERRAAHYVCNVAVADPAGTIRLQLEAECHGRITMEARGTHAFGYDPYFLIPEYHRTFGELSPIVKRHLSHRGRAFERLIPQLVRLLKSGPHATS
jgi:XTP/dITP diphosphohydrolase